MDVAVFSWGNQPAGHGTLPSQGLLLRLHLGMASFGPLLVMTCQRWPLDGHWPSQRLYSLCRIKTCRMSMDEPSLQSMFTSHGWSSNTPLVASNSWLFTCHNDSFQPLKDQQPKVSKNQVTPSQMILKVSTVSVRFMNIHCSPGYAPGIPLTAVGFNLGNILRDVTCLDWRSWCYDASGPWCLWPTESSYMPRTELVFMPWLPIVRYVWMHLQATDATGTNNEALPLSQRIFWVSTLSKKMQKGGYGFLYFQWFHWVRPHRGHTQKGPPMKSPHVVRRNNALTDETFSILQ